MADITNETLNQILNSIEQYRDDLVAKLNETGAQLSSNATLYEALQKVSGQGPSVEAVAGYIVNQDGKLVFKSLQDSSSLSMSSLYIPDTPEQPQYSAASGGGSIEFYKCTSVNTSDATWSGKKAVLSDGVYAFESNSYSELKYTIIKPVVGQVYSQDAKITATLFTGMPTDGLVFYAPLKEDSGVVVGNSLNSSGSITYTTYKGLPCAHFDGSSNLYQSQFQSDLPTGYNDRSVSGWIYAQAEGWAWMTGWGRQGTNQGSSGAEILGLTSDWYPAYSSSPDAIDSSTNISDRWYHLCGVVQGGVRKLYVNGTLKASIQMTNGTGSTYGVYIGSSCGVEFFTGYLSSIRIYDRVLTQSQIQLLASEFTPTA